MRITLLLVGKTVNKHFVELIDDYAARVKHYVGFDIVTIPELKNTKAITEQQQKEREGEMILQRVTASDALILNYIHHKLFIKHG